MIRGRFGCRFRIGVFVGWGFGLWDYCFVRM